MFLSIHALHLHNTLLRWPSILPDFSRMKRATNFQTDAPLLYLWCNTVNMESFLNRINFLMFQKFYPTLKKYNWLRAYLCVIQMNISAKCRLKHEKLFIFIQNIEEKLNRLLFKFYKLSHTSCWMFTVAGGSMLASSLSGSGCNLGLYTNFCPFLLESK